MSTYRSKKHNSFAAADYHTFAVAKNITAKLRAAMAKGADTQITVTAGWLYIYFAEQAQGDNKFVLETARALRDLHMSPNTFKTSREQLSRLDLIKFSETSKGIFQYELRGVQGGTLTPYYDDFDWKATDIDEVKVVYQGILDDYDEPVSSHDRLSFTCPFCNKRRKTLHVTIKPDDSKHGFYICGNNSCKKTGNTSMLLQIMEHRRTGNQMTREASQAETIRRYRAAAADRQAHLKHNADVRKRGGTVVEIAARKSQSNRPKLPVIQQPTTGVDFTL